MLLALPVIVLAILRYLLYESAGRSGWNRQLPAFVRFYLLTGAVCIAAGGIRMQLEQQWAQSELGLLLDGRTLTAEGTLSQVSSTADREVLLLKDCTVISENAGGQLKRLLVYVQQDTGAIPAGSRVRVTGKVSDFDRARNPGEFDYRLYYRSRKLNYRMKGRSADVVKMPAGRFREWLRRIRSGAIRTLNQTAGGDAGVYRAMVLGDKTGLDEDLQELYQRSGISHLFAISGLHMSLIGMGAYRLIRKAGAGFLLSGIVAGSLIIIYVMMIGASASVIRALVMLLAAFLAAYLGRTYDLLSALALAVLLILWDSPYQICQAGFQLSAGAVLGVGLLVPELERIGPRAGNTSRLFQVCQKSILASLGIQLATLPVILYHFFQLPLYGILINPVVIPLMGVVVVSGIMGILLGGFFPAAGVFAAGPGHYILSYYECLCRLFQRLPGSTLIRGRPELWQISVYYLILGAAVWLAGRKQRSRFLLPALAAGLILHPLPVTGLRVTFLDVGQGDGIVVQTGRHTVLVDGGSSSFKNLGKYRLEPFLKSRGITVIDYAYVTHADLDHISGLMYLMESGRDIRIRNLMLPVLGKTDEAYRQLVLPAVNQGVTIHWIAEDDGIGDKTFRIDCLYPREQDIATDRNSHSSVLQVDYGGFHMLLTGDMGEVQEQNMLGRTPIAARLPEIQVLKLAHHGSRLSSSEAWLEQIDPVWAVVSYGADNTYGHPHREVRERLARQNIILYETAQNGAIWLDTDGTDIRWSLFCR